MKQSKLIKKLNPRSRGLAKHIKDITLNILNNPALSYPTIRDTGFFIYHLVYYSAHYRHLKKEINADKRIRTPAGTKPLDSESNQFDRSGTSA